jgi:hypothetical protein
MITVYAILLYLHMIFSGTSYTQATMNTIIVANQPSITAIQQDSVLLDQVMTQYGDIARGVEVIDPSAGK